MTHSYSILRIWLPALLLAAVFVVAMPPSFGGEAIFELIPIAYVGDEAPRGGQFASFEPYGLNESGQASFTGDLSTGGGGIFVWNRGVVREIVRSGEPAPGGGELGVFPWGRASVNGAGDIAFQFTLSPLEFPLGLNAGLYRLPKNGKPIQGIVVPGITAMPGGGHFAGISFDSSLNNRGDLAFNALVPDGDLGPGPPGLDGLGVGHGIFLAERDGAIRKLVVPGDGAPDGGVFDYILNVSLNDGGDLAFGAHLDGEECIVLFDQEFAINCGESIYFMDGRTGEMRSIVHQGDPAPGGGIFRSALGPLLSNRGDIAFVGDLTAAPGAWEQLGVFLFSRGAILPVAMPGDAMPGGGVMVTASFKTTNVNMNNRGDLTFVVSLDVDDNQDGLDDNGIYIWSHGEIQLVARVGTEIPGVGVVRNMVDQIFRDFGWLYSPTGFNNAGQILFQVLLEDGRTVLLLATPSKEA